MGSDYLGSINQSIGENMRFIRDFHANPQKYASQSSSSNQAASNGAGHMSQMLNPIIMLMMFQMMMKMMTQLGARLPEGYPPIGTAPSTVSGNAPDPGGAITQNPAVQYFDKQFQ